MQKKQFPLAIAVVIFLFTHCTNIKTQQSMIPSELPEAPIAAKKDSLLTFHDDTRVDPYFWMRLTDEQKNADTPDQQTQQVLDYLNSENAYTDSVMKNTDELQKNLFDEIVGRIKKDDESVPYFSNGYWYYVKYEEGKEYPIICRKKDSLDNTEIIILNVNELAEGHEYYAATSLRVSADNKILAFSEDTVSRRIYTVRFKNLETGEFLTDEIGGVSAGGAWANDNKTFFYTSKNTVSLLSEKIWRHELGSLQKNDVMVYHEKDPSFYIGVYKSKSDKYIIISESSTLESDYHILNANDPSGDFKQFTPKIGEHEYSIDHFEDKFFIVTNHNATNFKLMETPESSTEMNNWKEIIAHREDVLLEGIDIFKEHLVISERKNALNHIRIINQKTKDEHYLNFGEEVYVTYTSTNPEFDTPILRYGYSSLTTPNSTIDYNMDTKSKEVKKVSEVVGGHTPEDYKVERQWAKSRDGVDVPISIVYKKGTKLDGTAPLLLYAYGSYGSTVDTWFSSTRLSLLDRGFIYAIAHIRGGQSMGRKWYDDGKMMKKINTFNDYIDCSKYLIDSKYTSPQHLYAMGGSAGGLLMGAIVNMQPDLYNGVIAAVPFVDVVSTMLDETIPLTTNEFDEWGNPKNKESYDYMMKYSPYDNVKAQQYPNMLITTGLFDSQVQYWEPAKWLAKLRDTKVDNNLLIMHTNMEAGHGGASGRFKRYKETALEYSFLFMLEGINK
ncbi:S9 family peptidase [Labilibacter marinus]|uniref:S9 family peptidase n=1 Tax=Labilibacter marinus TaxID=1477105 RepID=UPI0018E94345|nr:S9 family peptidase [Labilibacter marinus]